MKNHFGNGLMAGFNMVGPCPGKAPSKYCSDYTRGFVLGYCYQLEQKTGERKIAALEAGRLTRQYNLDKKLMAEFFVEGKTDGSVQYFNIGYAGE